MAAKFSLAGELSLDEKLLRSIQVPSKLKERVGELFELLQGPVYRYLVGILEDSTEAEDLTQEAFLRLYLAVRKGETIGSIRPWIFRVAHNLAVDQQRKGRHTGTLDQDQLDLTCDRTPDSSPDAEQRVLIKEQHQRIQSALARLSPQERRCLDLRTEGLRYREIAETLGIRVSTVVNFLERGIVKIMRQIHE